MTSTALQTLIGDILQSLRQAQQNVTPDTLETVENLAVQVKARPVVQQALRVGLNESTEKIIDSCDSAIKLVAMYRQMTTAGTMTKLIGVLEKVQKQTTLLWMVAPFV